MQPTLSTAPTLPAPTLTAAAGALAQALDAIPDAPAAHPAGDFTRARQVEFLHALADCGAVRAASSAVGISYRTVYRERRASPGFRRAWDAALISARALHQDVLATRAIDGVEEVVWFRGEEVGRRVRYSDRLLLAHLARLDKLTEDARARAFADDIEGALERFAAGIDDPAPVCDGCGAALPAPATGADGDARGSSPGLCDKCDRAAAPRAAEAAADAPPEPCPDCGGGCLGPVHQWDLGDCRYYEMRIEEMYEAHPADAPWPHDFTGLDPDAVEAEQLEAFEAGLDRWWLVVPSGEGDDPDAWYEWAGDLETPLREARRRRPEPRY